MKKSILGFGIVFLLVLTGCQSSSDENSGDFFDENSTAPVTQESTTPPTSEDLNAQAVNDFFTQGNTLFEQKDYSAAMEMYDKALDLLQGESRIRVLSNKATALYFLERYEDSIAVYDEILTIDPNNAESLSSKGAPLLKLKRFDEALAIYKNIISNTPDKFEPFYNTACTYALMGNKDLALENLKEAIKINVDLKTYAKQDTDLESLWQDPVFLEITTATETAPSPESMTTPTPTTEDTESTEVEAVTPTPTETPAQ